MADRNRLKELVLSFRQDWDSAKLDEIEEVVIALHLDKEDEVTGGDPSKFVFDVGAPDRMLELVTRLKMAHTPRESYESIVEEFLKLLE